MDLNNSGEFLGDTASLLIISNSRETKITGQNFQLFSLKIAGNVNCQVSTLSLDGDLIMQFGVMDIGASRLVINGDLLGETEQTYVTASTGTIEKPIDRLLAGQQATALGLEFTPLGNKANARIIRSHRPVFRLNGAGSYKSAYRVYEFSSPKNITNIQLQTKPHEKQHLTRDGLFVENFFGWERVRNNNDDLLSVLRISVFAPDDLHFPKILTPYEVTNNVFKIAGLEEYPNARLVIINKRGQILHDFYPYKNDFDGRNLPTGTYYYVFSERLSSQPMKKSFFELIR